MKFLERTVVLNGQQLTEFKPALRQGNHPVYLKLDLPLVATFVPDWNLLIFYLMRHTAMNGIPKNGQIKLRAPFWKLAGVQNKARRRKVLDLIEKHAPKELCHLERGRGRCASVILGPEWPRP